MIIYVNSKIEISQVSFVSSTQRNKGELKVLNEDITDI